MLAVAVIFVAVRDASADPQTFVVNNTASSFDTVCSANPGGCTLPDAIEEANNSPGPDTITFNASITQLSLDQSLLSIDGRDGVTIESTGATVTLAPTAGSSTQDGMVIRSDTGITVQNVTVRNMAFLGFAGSGLVICGGTVVGMCANGDVKNVTIDHVASLGNTLYGVRVWGNNVSTVNVNTLDTENNGFDGLSIIGQAEVAGVDSVKGITVASHTSFSDRVGISVASGADIETVDIGGSNISLGTTGIAIQAISTSDVNLHGNMITDESFVGMGFQQGNLGSTLFVTVENNIIERTATGEGLLFSTPTLFASDILNNQIRDTGKAGINLDSTEDYGGDDIMGNIIERTAGDGIRLFAPDEAQQMNVEGNTVTSATGNGIWMSGIQFSANTIKDNTVSLSGLDGIHIQGAAPKPDLLSPNSISGNTVFGNAGDGIEISPNGAATFPIVTISQNSTHDNGEIGIDLYAQTDPSPGVTPNDAGDTDTGTNSLLNFPEAGGDTALAVTGLACANCTVELFVSDGDPSGHGEGKQYIAFAQSDGVGAFAVPICGHEAGTQVTLTATNAAHETSEFSGNYTLTSASDACPTPTPSASPTPSPSPVPTPEPTPGPRKGDLDCNNVVDAPGGLVDLQFVALTQLLSRPPTCPNPNTLAGGFQYGDMDCDGDVDVVDGLEIVAAAAGVPRDLPPGCAPIDVA